MIRNFNDVRHTKMVSKNGFVHFWRQKKTENYWKNEWNKLLNVAKAVGKIRLVERK